MEEILPFGEAFAEGIGEDLDLEQSMADIDELMRNL